MKRQIALVVSAVCCLSAAPIFGQSLALGTAEGEFGTAVTLPLTLSTSPRGEPVQAAQVIFDWPEEAGTGIALNIDPSVEADADFVSFHVGSNWMALGFTVVTAPITGDDVRLAGVVVQCGPGPAATEAPVSFRDGVYNVPGSSLVLSNTVTIDSTSVRKENGLDLVDGSFRCFGEEVCGDGVDGDGDGLADADDPDCPAAVDVTPLALDFDSVFVGTASSLDVTIANTGSRDLTVSSVGILGSPDFSITDTPITPAVLSPGEDVRVTVTYAPQEDELDLGDLRIVTDVGEVVVALTGSGLPTLSAGLGAHLPLDCSAEDLVSGESGVVIALVGCGADRFEDDNMAMLFDGNGFVNGSSFPVVAGDFILEAWLRPDAIGGPTTTSVFAIHHPDDPVQVPPLSLEWDAMAHLLMLKRGDSPIAVQGLAPAWHHVLTAREAASLSLYVDGQLMSTIVDSDLVGGAYSLGADMNGSRLYHGRLDELILEVSTLDGEAEVINRALRGGPSAYVRPSGRVRDVTATLGLTARAIDLRITTSSSESSQPELRSLILVADDITTAGGASPNLDYLEGGRLVLETECGVPESQVTVGEFVVSQTGVGTTTFTLTSVDPVLLPVASESCLSVLFDVDEGAPLDRVIQFRVEMLDDIRIVGDDGEERFLVGERLMGKAALQGDRLKIRSAPPPELELMFPVDMEPVNAASSVPDAEMHTLTLAAGASEGLRLLDIAYRAAEGTSLDGLSSPRLLVDLNGNGVADAGEDIRGGVVSTSTGRVLFTGLGIEIPASSETDLVLLADLELSGSAVAGALVIPLLLAAVGLLLARRHLGRQPQLSSALALLVVCCVIGIGAGCSGGGGGGGGSGKVTTEQRFQLMIDSASDIRVEGLTSGTEPTLTAFPADGIPGPLYILKG